MKFKKYLALLLIMCTFVVTSETISIKNINESYSETVKVSGSFYLGMQFKGKDELGKLNILFPDHSTGTLCIDIASIDGRYKASIVHKLSSTVSGLNQLDFPSKYQRELNKYKPDELAVRSSVGKSCSEGNDNSLIASWSNNIENHNVVLLIRSDARKDVVYIPGVAKGFKCKKFKNEYKVTYDKYCEMKGIDITKVDFIQIKRKNLQKMPDEIIKLAYKNEK